MATNAHLSPSWSVATLFRSVTLSIGKGHTIPIDTSSAADIEVIALIRIDMTLFSRCKGLNNRREQTTDGMRDGLDFQEVGGLYMVEHCGQIYTGQPVPLRHGSMRGGVFIHVEGEAIDGSAAGSSRSLSSTAVS
jgi:hypothetical protein